MANAGRNFGNIKTYLSYDYTSFKAKQIGVQTPYGEQVQSLSDDYRGHSIGFNADYKRRLGRSLFVFAGIGAGYFFSESSSQVYEYRIGAEKKAGSYILGIGATYRITPQEMRFKHKDIEHADQVIYALSFSKNF